MPRRGRGVTLESKELLRFKPTALQKETPFGGILFLLVKKEYGERHAKEPMVLWKLLVPKRGPRRSPAVRWVRWGKEEQRSERAFRPWAETRDAQLATTLGYRLRLDVSVLTFSHRCLARILISGGVPELRPICLQKGSAGQPLGNSFPKERSLPLVLRRFVPTAPRRWCAATP